MKQIYFFSILLSLSMKIYSQRTFVPDDNFERALIDLGIDDRMDNYVDNENIINVPSLDISGKQITSLQGIQGFRDLQTLDCSGNNISSIDLSNSTFLTYLRCGGNNIPSLDLSNCTLLTYLSCGGNNLSSLDLSSNSKLVSLFCSGNNLNNLNISSNEELVTLSCDGNDMSSLIVNSSLQKLICYDNKLIDLNLSTCQNLKTLNCRNNNLISLNLSNNTKLVELNCNYNDLTELVLGNNSILEEVLCWGNSITSLDVTQLPNLKDLKCFENELNSLDVTQNSNLIWLDFTDNNISSIDVTKNLELLYLDCDKNNLSNLDIIQNTKLQALYCGYNSLSSLDISNNLSLEALSCEFNNITGVLDLTEHTNLFGIVLCNNNKLTGLKLPEIDLGLWFVRCNDNFITRLDFTSLGVFEELYCHNNNLQSLKVSSFITLYADNNPDLYCIEVDEIYDFYETRIDPQMSFSEIPCEVFPFNIDFELNEYELELEDLSVSADGSKSTLFKFYDTDYDNIQFQVKEDTDKEEDLYGSFEEPIIVNDTLSIYYNHPKYFPYENKQGEEVTVEIINTESNEVQKDFPLKIVRPSVLMVHGIWSNGEKAFSRLLTRLQKEEMYIRSQLQYYEYAGDRHNEYNKFDFKSNGIDNLKKTTLENNISLGKIDVLAHSNGGLLTRQYIQDNTYENDINKLITLNTPHSGSQLANYLLSNETFAIYLRGLMAEHRFYTEKGVIDDLRVDGDFIKNLNNHSTEQFLDMYESIGVHSIYSTQTVAGEAGNIDESIFFWLKYKSIGIVDNFLETDIFNTPYHDLVVPQSSQIGGVENTRLFQNQSHMGTANNADIQNWIIDLLNKNPNDSDYFSSKGYNPLTLLSNYNASKKQTSKVTGDEAIIIKSPIAGTEINAGEIIAIEANGSSGIENIVSSMGNTKIPLQNQVTENSTTANFSFTIPNNALGRLEIVSAGFSANGFEDFDSTYIIVTTDAILESIEIDQSLIYVPEGRESVISILGHYDDGEIRNITNIETIAYSFSENNAELRERGLITGLNEGEDLLTVSYSGQSATVPITIVSSAALEIEDIANFDKDFIVYPNPVKEILTIKFPINIVKAKVSIYDLLGKKIFKKEINTNNNELYISSFKNGMYLVKIKTERTTVIKRIMKH